MTLAELRKRRAGPQPAVEPVVHVTHEERHPGPLEYAQIGAVLAVITLLEVSMYYLGVGRTVLVLALLVMSALKFSLVVLWFMHLKFDNRLFSGMFILGLLLAFAVFLVALSTVGGKLV